MRNDRYRISVFSALKRVIWQAHNITKMAQKGKGIVTKGTIAE